MYIKVIPLQISQGLSMNDSYVLTLSAPERGKHVPILIGEPEAQAVVMASEQRTARRPLTHNLICEIMDQYLLSLLKVTIDRFDEGVFYSTLHISDGFSEKHIDSRTSDAVVLAILQHCDIYMDSGVFEETSMEPGALNDNLPPLEDETPSEPTLEELENLLRQCEEAEDYEQAAEVLKRIQALKNEQP